MTHDIPADGAPHSRSTECGCGPQRVIRDGLPVLVHNDQRTHADQRTEAP